MGDALLFLIGVVVAALLLFAMVFFVRSFSIPSSLFFFLPWRLQMIHAVPFYT